MSVSYLFVQIMDIVPVVDFASTAMARTHSCRVSFPWVLHKFQEICSCPCFHQECHSAWVLLQPMIHVKHASICRPELLQVPWDVRRAHPYFLELMATVGHNTPTIPESFLSSKTLRLQYITKNQRNSQTSLYRFPFPTLNRMGLALLPHLRIRWKWTPPR